MIELRWLVKADGSKVLQYRYYDDRKWNWSDWQDVPEVKEGENGADS